MVRAMPVQVAVRCCVRVAAMLALADLRFGPGAALLLRTGYQAARVPVEEAV